MEIKLGLILIACIVNFGLTCVQSPSQVVHQAVFNKGSYKREIRENLQNLFDSISVHDSEKSGAYHEFLNKGIVKEQEAFDAMKEELRFARSTNINKRKKIDENVAVMKREANVNNSSSGSKTSECRLADSLITPKALERLCEEVLVQIRADHELDEIGEVTYVPVHQTRLKSDRIIRNTPIFPQNPYQRRDKVTTIACIYMEFAFYLSRANATHVYRLDRNEDNSYRFRDQLYPIKRRE